MPSLPKQREMANGSKKNIECIIKMRNGEREKALLFGDAKRSLRPWDARELKDQ